MVGQKTTKSVKIFPLEKFRLYGSVYVCVCTRAYVCVCVRVYMPVCVHVCEVVS